MLSKAARRKKSTEPQTRAAGGTGPDVRDSDADRGTSRPIGSLREPARLTTRAARFRGGKQEITAHVRDGRFAPACGLLLALLTLIPTAGCVRRTLTITTEPPNALVFLNDREVGRSDLTVDFVWYGDYDVVVRHEGYDTLKTNHHVKRPWYQYPPIDFFAEVFWPGHIVDRHSAHFVMTEQVLPEPDELIDRAVKMRDDSLAIEPQRSSPVFGG